MTLCALAAACCLPAVAEAQRPTRAYVLLANGRVVSVSTATGAVLVSGRIGPEGGPRAPTSSTSRGGAARAVWPRNHLMALARDPSTGAVVTVVTCFVANAVSIVDVAKGSARVYRNACGDVIAARNGLAVIGAADARCAAASAPACPSCTSPAGGDRASSARPHRDGTVAPAEPGIRSSLRGYYALQRREESPCL